MATIRKRTWVAGDTVKTAWIADYFDQARKRHIKTFTRKKDAERWLDQARGEIRQGIHSPPSTSITVAGAGETHVVLIAADGSRWVAGNRATADDILRAVNELPSENQWYAKPPEKPIGGGPQLLRRPVGNNLAPVNDDRAGANCIYFFQNVR